MITAVHTLIYSDDAAATRAFFRDVLQWPFVAEDSGWLIFQTGPSELGVHPTSGTHEGETWSHPRHHSVSLMCDDVAATVVELEARGAEFEGAIQDLGFGLAITLELPGAGAMMLYQPKHRTAYDL